MDEATGITGFAPVACDVFERSVDSVTIAICGKLFRPCDRCYSSALLFTSRRYQVPTFRRRTANRGTTTRGDDVGSK